MRRLSSLCSKSTSGWSARSLLAWPEAVALKTNAQCDPAVKLPALYLLDSICKNIGSPYTTLFAQRIDRIFLSAFRDVDPPTKIKMEELLGTWRTGGPNGGQLFQGRAQKDIEQVLFGDGLRGGGIGGQGKGVNDNRHFLSGVRLPHILPSCVSLHSAQAQQLPSMASKAERQSVLSDVRRLLAIWEMRQNMHPEDDNPREQIAALKQVRISCIVSRVERFVTPRTA